MNEHVPRNLRWRRSGRHSIVVQLGALAAVPVTASFAEFARTPSGALMCLALFVIVVAFVYDVLWLSGRLRRYRVDYGAFCTRYFVTLRGARRWRNRRLDYKLTRLYWRVDGQWVEMS